MSRGWAAAGVRMAKIASSKTAISTAKRCLPSLSPYLGEEGAQAPSSWPAPTSVGHVDDLDAAVLGAEGIGCILELALAVADGDQVDHLDLVLVGEELPHRFGAADREILIVRVPALGVGVAGEDE